MTVYLTFTKRQTMSRCAQAVIYVTTEMQMAKGRSQGQSRSLVTDQVESKAYRALAKALKPVDTSIASQDSYL